MILCCGEALIDFVPLPEVGGYKPCPGGSVYNIAVGLGRLGTPDEIARAALTLARYKRLILLGKTALPLEEARRLVGPDCAYHLYFRHAGESPDAEGRQSRPGLSRRRRVMRRHK